MYRRRFEVAESAQFVWPDYTRLLSIPDDPYPHHEYELFLRLRSARDAAQKMNDDLQPS